MKIYKSVKIAVGVALLAPLAMYAVESPDVLGQALATVKSSVTGPMKGILVASEVVIGGWGYITTKSPAVLLGLPIVVAFTAFGMNFI
ncbi:MAG: hypothetical protein KBD25_00445 [Rickettsiaceae bacterium]|nr:hypothetical protein [Rickettsiaceae bacterium]